MEETASKDKRNAVGSNQERGEISGVMLGTTTIKISLQMLRGLVCTVLK